MILGLLLGIKVFFCIILIILRILFFIENECWNISEFELFFLVNGLLFFFWIKIVGFGILNLVIVIFLILFISLVVSLVFVFFLWIILFFFSLFKDMCVGVGYLYLLIKSFLYLLVIIECVFLFIWIIVMFLFKWFILFCCCWIFCLSLIIVLLIKV